MSIEYYSHKNNINTLHEYRTLQPPLKSTLDLHLFITRKDRALFMLESWTPFNDDDHTSLLKLDPPMNMEYFTISHHF